MFLRHRFRARLGSAKNPHCCLFKLLRRSGSFVVFVFHWVIMRLTLAVFLVVLAASSGNEGKNQPKPRDAAEQRKAQASEKTSIPAVIQEAPPSQAQNASNREKDDTSPKPKPWMSHAEWVMSGLTLIYVVLTGVYVSYSAKTLRELQKQIGLIEKQDIATNRQLEISQTSADAARQSVALQKAQLAQWVELDGWEGHSENFIPGATRATYWLSFSVINPTNIPLTLTRVDITTPDKRPVMRIAKEEYVIPPKNGYSIKWPTVITDETVIRLARGTWEFSLVIEVEFIDLLEAKKSVFSMACKCHVDHCDVKQYKSRHQF